MVLLLTVAIVFWVASVLELVAAASAGAALVAVASVAALPELAFAEAALESAGAALSELVLLEFEA